MARFIYPLTSYTLTQGFGANPAYYSQYGQQGHNGLDLGNSLDTPVYAASDGTVEFEGWGQNNSWMGSVAGICIIINHGDIRTGYAHLNSTVINRGQQVGKGQLIGYLGSTGAATGPHTHFEFIGGTFNNGYAGRINPNQFDLGYITNPQGGDDMIDQDTLTKLFNIILGRNPDPDAVSHYVGHYTTSFVVSDLLNSSERQQYAANQAAAQNSIQAQLTDTQSRLAAESATIDNLNTKLTKAYADIDSLKKSQGGVDEATKQAVQDTNQKVSWIQNLLAAIFNRSK